MDNKNTFSTVLIVQTVTLVVALITAAVNLHNTNISKQKELETQLILNAYSLPDSTAQIERLKNFCELKFFEEERRIIIEDKIKKGTMYVPKVLVIYSDMLPPSTVYVCTAIGASKYHSHYCKGLKKCNNQIETINRFEAVERGYSPCAYCFK